MVKSKKAQGLPMNTVIIAILILVVLVVIIAFFLGGTGSVVDKFRSILNPRSAMSASEARDECNRLCNELENVDIEDTKAASTSRFCNMPMTVDNDGDGAPDRNAKGRNIKFYCQKDDVKDKDGTIISKGLGMSCPYINSCPAHKELFLQ